MLPLGAAAPRDAAGPETYCAQDHDSPMSMHRSVPTLSIGFLTVVRQVEHGYVGGYLIVNQLARPIEFHCTVPVKPNRAQEILYGRTLEPYLLGEQIGATLIGKSSSRPLLVCTDQPAVLAAQGMVEVPIALVVAGAVAEGSAATPQCASRPSYAAAGFDPHPTIALHSGHASAAGTAHCAHTADAPDTAHSAHSAHTSDIAGIADTAGSAGTTGSADIAGTTDIAGTAGQMVRAETVEVPGLRSATAALRGRLQWGGYELRLAHLEPATYAEIERRLHELPPDFDLCEPLERIREADGSGDDRGRRLLRFGCQSGCRRL